MTPDRIRVTRAARSVPALRRTATSEIDAQSEVGRIYMASLVRSQLRLALLVLLTLVGTVGGLPVLFRLVPALSRAEVLGMPVAWVVLGFAVYPWLVFLAWRYVRQSERHERAFAQVVERP